MKSTCCQCGKEKTVIYSHYSDWGSFICQECYDKLDGDSQLEFSIDVEEFNNDPKHWGIVK